MSLNKQEALLLEERIEKIRKKNEEIKRRHLEVEADKQNAAKLNALVQISGPIDEDWPVGGRSSPHEKERRFPQNNRNNNITTRSLEGNVPSPEPAYKFLADSERDVQHAQKYCQQPQQRWGRGGRGRGGFSRGRDRGAYHHGGGGDTPRPDYEAWRAERNRIDNDRINRQKTAEGHWRREWDNEKITQQEEDRPAARVSRGGGSRKNTDWQSSHNHNTLSQERASSGDNVTSRPPRGGGGRNMLPGNRSSIRGKRIIQIEHHSGIGDVVKEDPLHVCSKRNVVTVGESIKISVPNDSPVSNHSPVSAPVKRVKVNAPVVGGTGRVGPRQKIRLSYSSQSEDEAHQLSNTTSSTTTAHPETDGASTKPPLPPYTSLNPKPRRLRPKRLENDAKQRKRESLDNKENSEVNECQNETESGGDDSWEDVTTTSGNESTCEELSPRSKTETKVLATAVQKTITSHGDESGIRVSHDNIEESFADKTEFLNLKDINQEKREVQVQSSVSGTIEHHATFSEISCVPEEKQETDSVVVSDPETLKVMKKENAVISDISSCLEKQGIEKVQDTEIPTDDGAQNVIHPNVTSTISMLTTSNVDNSQTTVILDDSVTTTPSGEENSRTTDTLVASTSDEKDGKRQTIDVPIQD